MGSTNGYRIFFGVGLLFLLSFSVYSNTFRNGFVFDDNEQIVHNHWIKDFRYLPDVFTSGVWNFREFQENDGGYYRPMMHAFFAIEYYFFKLNPIGYHGVNVFLHFADATLFFVFLLIILPQILPPGQESKVWGGVFALALLSAAFFSLHPINSEVVNWIAAMPELSYAFFYLLTLIFYFRANQKKIYLFVSLFFFSLALFCKETAVTLPIFLFFYYFFLQNSTERNLGKRIKLCLLPTIPFIIASLIFIVIREWVLGVAAVGSLTQHFVAVTIVMLATSIVLFAKSIIEIVLPFKLSIFHPFYPTDLRIFYALTVAVPPILFWCVVFRRHITMRANKVIMFGSILFLIPLLPALNALYLGVFVLSERYLYVPSMGFSLMCTFLLLSIVGRVKKEWARRTIFLFAVSIVLLMFFIVDFKRSEMWKDDRSLFLDTVAKYPESELAQQVLAKTYCQEGDIEKCQDQYRIYCDTVAKQNDGEEETCMNSSDYALALGNAYYIKNDFGNAINYYELVLQLDPTSAEATFDLGRLYVYAQDYLNAKKFLEQALILDSKSPSVNKYLGLLYCDEANHNSEAAGYFIEAMRLGTERDELTGVKGECLDNFSH